MFNFEYRFTQTYEDKFTKPFTRSINFAEKSLKKLTTQTFFAVEKVNDLGKSFEKAGKNAKFEIKPNIKLPKIDKKLSFNLKKDENIEQNLNIKPKIGEFKDINKEGIYEFKPEIALTSKFKNQFNKIQNKFHSLENVKIKPDDRQLKKLQKKKLQMQAEIKPDTSQLEKVEKGGIHLNMLVANVDTSNAKEQLLSFSEGLYEATKYGLNKANLGKEIAKQVKELDGLVSMSEMSNAVVSALKVGIRGSEKQLAQYAKEIQKFHELTGKSYEESAQLIYKLKDKFKLPTKEISKVIDEMAVLRKNFAITEDDLTNALSSVKDEFGTLLSAMDKTTKSKFTEGMLKWSAALEQMHISTKDTFDLVNKALEGDSQAWTILSQGGISFSQLQKAMQEGNIEKVAKAYEKSIINIGKQLKEASPIMRKQLMQMYGLSEEMANSFMEAASQAEELHKQTEKAFTIQIKGGEAQKQWEEATNPFTKGIQKIQNEIMAFFGDKIPSEIFDSFSGIDSLILLAITNKFGLFDRLKGVGTSIGGKILGEIKGIFTKGKIGLPQIAKPPALSTVASSAKVLDKVDDVSKVSGVLSKTSKFSKVLGLLGKLGRYGGKLGVVGSIVGGVLTIGSALASDEGNKTEKVAKAAGSVGGSVAGSAIGAAIGTAILPGIGTAIGGFLGSIAGGWLGEKLGGKAGEVISEGEKEKQLLEKPQVQKQETQPQPDEMLNTLYEMQKQLSSINTNTAFIVQMNQLMSQYIELLKLIAKQSGQNIDDIVFKGFNR